ncbi:hypothetical protein [Poriferisphaera sp. WC338]|uniref:hypothetical protein n=1 Tax=Poriferisphaera sp. WC338 TaxID=3425129 RepID=UPI003D814D9D
MKRRNYRSSLWLLMLLFMMTSCTSGGENPSFSISMKQASKALEDMSVDPAVPDRPVLVLSGWMVPRSFSQGMADDICKGIDRKHVVPLSFFGTASFNDSANTVVQTLEKRFPSDDEYETVEVDVVAFSMGGLIARYAAIPPTDAPMTATFAGKKSSSLRKRLNINRLYTICTPHKGAQLAPFGMLDPSARDMITDSDLLQALDQDYAVNHRFDLKAYARLHDLIVGEQNTAPEGEPIWWVGRTFSGIGHVFANRDPRILADILRELRQEQGFTRPPASPIPN